ncbi:hypothetical protein Halha_1582 [Halobacteroides halobius DSM 5150]|uniref:DUF5723 domain-containing protein n=1 Tax=Halobacteroides halobius (strain ATCC 35273 / DSM 5150 / MD-1) TaxID=748449 RepID=L0KAF0_HALHC|nr:hypothetical protein [Halobacteroides halobius]AGB41520.1 hypothetical protein Halha_1582 [Halobacteroides halobius DSM 5150]
MKKFYTLLIAVLLVTVMINPVSAAKPGSYNKFGTKAYGMGGAFTAVADDASAIYWNPAGLTQSSLLGVQASAGGQLKPSTIKDITDFIKQAKGLSDEEVTISEVKGLNFPENANINLNGMVAANLTNFGVGAIVNDRISITSRKETVTFEGIEREVTKARATNTIIGQGIVAYGMELIDPPIVGSLSIGGSAKALYAKENGVNIDPDPDPKASKIITKIDPKAKKGLGADVGALITLSDMGIVNLKAGVSIKNLVNTLEMTHSALERTTTVGLGATFNFPMINILSARVAADLEIPKNGPKIQRIGAEGTLGLFSLRLGAYGTNLAKSAQRTITGGFGVNLPFIDFNIAADSEGYANLSGTFNF